MIRKEKTKGLLLLITSLILLTACNYNNKVYNHYVEADPEGWEKNEAVIFGIDSLKESGQYALMLGMRISDNYPFQNLQVVVDQTIYPSQQTLHDIIMCKVMDKHGIMLGHGISMYQYDIPVRKSFYHKGDSISIKIRHNMKREILPGIINVGVILKK